MQAIIFKTTATLIMLLLPLAIFANDSSNIADSTREVVLDNGFTLLMVQRPGQPNIAAGWVARVGSANEHPGITGMSHLFEHMMFKGSPRIGTRNFELDRELREQLDDVRREMFAEERNYRDQVRQGYGESINDAELQSDNMAGLKSQFEQLIQAQRDNMIKDEFDKIYTDAGASRLNAFTNRDMTVYFIQVPKNKLELWFWMESERLLQPVFREFYAERDVVYEERRLRTDSTPTGAQDEVFGALFWRGHPYGWPIVGWPSDISAITREQAADFYKTYYAPSNITLALVGDFDEDQAIAWANEYLGRVPAGADEPPDVITLAMPQMGELVYQAEVEAPPSASVVWRTTAFAGADDPALQVLQAVLAGKTGRLYKRLVLGDQIATNIAARADSSKYDGSFTVSATGKQGIDPEQLRNVLLEEVRKLQEEGISDYELRKVKNQFVAGKFRALADPFSLMVQLLFFEGLRDWRTLDSYFARVLEVEAEQVQAAAVEYLTGDERAVKLYRRKASDEPEDPALAAFSDQERQQIRAMLQQLAAVPDDQLGGVLQQLQGMRAQAPAEAQASIDYVIEKVQERQGQ